MNYNDYLNLSEEEKSQIKASDIIDTDKFNFDCLTTRMSNYPSTEEWIKALIQKEIDGQSEEWNRLIEKRNLVKKKYPKIV